MDLIGETTVDKHEWRKQEKEIYLPKQKPTLLTIPRFKYVTISGKGNPNDPDFAEYIGALYSISYGIKMTAKMKGPTPPGHYDYTVYPLEGVWDITDEVKKNFSGQINKDDLVFDLMLRQPDFVTTDYFETIREIVQKKKPSPLLKETNFREIEEGPCIQMLHVGPYDNEPETFSVMEEFAAEAGVTRRSKVHREIYISDFRRTAPEKLKTVLRFQID